MAFVMRTHASGLVLAEHGQDEAALRRALRQLDDRLRLLPPGSWTPGDTGPSRYWRVMREIGGDRPAVHVLTWMDANYEPLPLSTGILDATQRLRKDSRNQDPRADELNAQLVAQNKRDRDAKVEAMHDEYEPHLERGRVGVSLGARNRTPYWQRRYRGGYR